MKKIICIVKESAEKEFREEIPELFELEEVEIQILKDNDFDFYISTFKEENNE